jgi:2,4-dienoyl-CoA reductase-like NADH-dependent reductase (Old Yellow Enzyme family)
MEPLMMFPRLFSRLAIGRVTLPNRIVSSGHDTVDGLVAASVI